jgi:hypothetical protein
MKRISLFLIVALCLGACGDKDKPLKPQERHAIRMQVGLRVTEIYDEVCRWYNSHVDSYEKNSFDEYYLTPDFLKLRNEARSIGAKKSEIPATLDYDHWIQGQDYAQVSVSVDSILIVSRDTAGVWITLNNRGVRPLGLLMVKTSRRDDREANWFIDDFVSPDEEGNYAFSEKEALKEYNNAVTTAHHPYQTALSP